MTWSSACSSYPEPIKKKENRRNNEGIEYYVQQSAHPYEQHIRIQLTPAPQFHVGIEDGKRKTKLQSSVFGGHYVKKHRARFTDVEA